LTYGPIAVLPDELAAVQGIRQAYLLVPGRGATAVSPGRRPATSTYSSLEARTSTTSMRRPVA
jgi:hypothetical protein